MKSSQICEVVSTTDIYLCHNIMPVMDLVGHATKLIYNVLAVIVTKYSLNCRVNQLIDISIG